MQSITALKKRLQKKELGLKKVQNALSRLSKIKQKLNLLAEKLDRIEESSLLPSIEKQIL